MQEKWGFMLPVKSNRCARQLRRLLCRSRVKENYHAFDTASQLVMNAFAQVLRGSFVELRGVCTSAGCPKLWRALYNVLCFRP